MKSHGCQRLASGDAGRVLLIAKARISEFYSGIVHGTGWTPWRRVGEPGFWRFHYPSV